MEEELLKKWDIHRVIQETIKTAHIQSAPETLARLKLLEDNQKRFMEKIESLEDKVDKLAVSIASLPDDIFKRADERYASKTAERAIYALVGALCLGIVYVIINSVVK